MSLRKLRRSATYTLADQVLSGASNAANIALAAVLLKSQSEAGSMMLALTLGYVAVSINRALVGDVLLVKASGLSKANATELIKDANSFAAVLAGTAAFALVSIAVILQDRGLVPLGPAVAVGIALPLVVLQDTGRYGAFSVGRPRLALFSDLAWVVVQAAIIAALLLARQVNGTTLVLAWGTGAAAGAAIFGYARSIRFGRHGIARWLKLNGRLSGWFTVASIVAQLQVQVVAFIIAGVLGPAAYSALRLIQTAILSPAQNLMMASMGALVPAMSSRFAKTKKTADHATFRRLMAVSIVGAAAIFVVFSSAIPWLITRFLPLYAGATPLVFPVSLQTALYLIQIPFAASIRAAGLASRLALTSTTSAVATGLGVLAGSYTGGLLGAAWGLFAGSVVSLGLHAHFGCSTLSKKGEPEGMSFLV